MVAPAPLPPIRFTDLAAALLQHADTLVPQWLPGGAKRGHEYVCGSLAGGKGSSCSVNLTNGRWGDFSTDEHSTFKPIMPFPVKQSIISRAINSLIAISVGKCPASIIAFPEATASAATW